MENGVYSTKLSTKRGETLSLSLDSKAGWDKGQLTGAFSALSVNASGYSDITSLSNGDIFADFAPVVSVKNGTATVKRALSVRVNLWLDRSNDHNEGVGTAKMTE